MERISPRTLDRLTELLGHTPAECDVLVRLLYFLTREETDPGVPELLNAAVGNDRAFETSVRLILNSDDVKQLENDERYQSFMAEIRDNTLSYSNDEAGDGQRFGFDFVSQCQSLLTATSFHLDRTMTGIPAAEQAAMAGAASRVADAALANKSAFIDAAKYLSVPKCVPVVAAAIICIQLGYDVYCNVRKWWKGEISGKRCIKNILDSGIGMVVGGLAGGYGGEALGALITMHPAGAIVGGVVGAIVGWAVTHAIIDRLTQKILDLPKSVALENAFRYLDLPVTASNNQVNTQYRRLALIYHPDRPGGSVDKFLSLQLYVGIIKSEREEGLAPGAPASGVPRAPIQVTGDED